MRSHCLLCWGRSFPYVLCARPMCCPSSRCCDQITWRLELAEDLVWFRPAVSAKSLQIHLVGQVARPLWLDTVAYTFYTLLLPLSARSFSQVYGQVFGLAISIQVLRHQQQQALDFAYWWRQDRLLWQEVEAGCSKKCRFNVRHATFSKVHPAVSSISGSLCRICQSAERLT